MARRKRRRSLTQTRSSGGGSRLRLFAVLGVLVAINLYVFLWRAGSSVPAVIKESRSETTRKKAPQNDEVEPVEAPKANVATAFSNPVQAVPAAPVAPSPATPEAAKVAAATTDKVPAMATQGRVAQGTVQKGDSLGRILRRENVDVSQADELIRSLRTHLDFRKIRVGQAYSLQIDGSGSLRRFEFVLSRTVKVIAERGADGLLVGRRETADTQIRIEAITGVVQGSLYKSIKANGGDPNLVGFFVDVFAYDLNFYVDTHKGDTFKIIVEREYIGSELLRTRNVLAAEYSGKAGTHRAFFWKAPKAKEGRYYDEKGRSLEKLLLKSPLKFARVSSKFDRHRMHPILHRVRAHLGVDYAAPTGTPIMAAAEGTITARSFRRGGGNTIVIRHDNGLETVYMHLHKFRRGQKRGQKVRGKQIIGYVGSTGMSTGPHLHFAVRKNGAYVDPMKIKMSRYKGVARRYKARFRRAIAPIVRRLKAARVVRSSAVSQSARRAGPDAEIQATHPAYRDQVRARKAGQKPAK